MSTDDDRVAQPRERYEAAPPQKHEHEQDREHVQEQEQESAATDARPPDAEPGSPPVRTPLPVRRPLPRRDAAPVAPALLSMISAQELAAEAPSIETLRRVRRSLRDLPDAN